jgi:hypothetical protein
MKGLAILYIPEKHIGSDSYGYFEAFGRWSGLCGYAIRGSVLQRDCRNLKARRT